MRVFIVSSSADTDVILAVGSPEYATTFPTVQMEISMLKRPAVKLAGSWILFWCVELKFITLSNIKSVSYAQLVNHVAGFIKTADIFEKAEQHHLVNIPSYNDNSWSLIHFGLVPSHPYFTTRKGCIR